MVEFHMPSGADSRIDIALSHYNNNDLRSAEIFCREIISSGPNDAEGWFLLGMIAKKRGQAKLAEECLEQAFKLKPNPVPKGFTE